MLLFQFITEVPTDMLLFQANPELAADVEQAAGFSLNISHQVSHHWMCNSFVLNFLLL